MKHTRSLRAFTLASVLTLLVLTGCKKNVPPPVEAPTEQDPTTISVTPDLARQLKVGEPTVQEVAGSLQVAARIDTDASRIARIGSPVAGRIIKLLALEGQNVHRGATLATLHSTGLSDTQFSFIKAYSQQKLAEQATDRAEQLVKADVMGRAELERRRAELLQATAEAAAFRTQLRGLGMSDTSIRQLENTRQLNPDYPVLSTIGGTVLERKVTIGQIVQPAEITFLVADLSNVWVLADVPEESAGRLHKGMNVIVKIPALPDQHVEGKLSYVAPIVDPVTRTVQVRMDLPNPHGIFKPAMLAGMTFLEHTERKTTVPSTSVVREENKDYVFIQVEPTKFMLREVSLGLENGDDRVLESGVGPGEKIVLDGAFHLNNQRKQNAIKGGQ
ncbi:efflux RND transporter periplasmic adaptor subunit [Edaphobacter albus]|uniref:efflux RND transporter periplasmic adaptor subunit n=1 Tax=Edaphobacter sp. 4G125 TaxID=2763071 RepID=UPI001C99439F|nr:efflux RND transporter periplasmic adaptor subunit [Edaphobacter sp. 4G125]